MAACWGGLTQIQSHGCPAPSADRLVLLANGSITWSADAWSVVLIARMPQFGTSGDRAFVVTTSTSAEFAALQFYMLVSRAGSAGGTKIVWGTPRGTYHAP